MRLLSELLAVLPGVERIGPADRPVGKIEFWLDEVSQDDLFTAIPGHPVDGHDRIDAAIAAGARTVLCERLPARPAAGVTWLRAPDSAAAMGLLAHAFHRFPSEKLRVVGVTGTNGKTSTAVLLHRLFRALGRRTGLLSNLGDYVIDQATAPLFTTGHALFIAGKMADMVAAGCTHAFMEVSSQSVGEQRLAGVAFDGGVFTNLTQDHLDVHGDMESYAGAKKAWLHSLPASAFALANGDDPLGAWMLEGACARRRTYGASAASAYNFEVLTETLDGLNVRIDGRRIGSRLLGGFNAANLAACYAVACELGEAPAEVAAALATLPPVEGRMQAIRAADDRVGVVDYAHSPDAVQQVLIALRRATPSAGRIVTVIGCGGGGDRSRRPEMGRIAARLSDRLILTTDNARWERPERIVADLLSYLDAGERGRTDLIADRREAIVAACASTRPGDLVLVAGKGAERFQEIAGVRTHFDDAEVLREALGLPPVVDAYSSLPPGR